MRWIKWIKETNDQVNDWTGSLAKRVKWAELRSFEDARAYSRRQAQTNQLVVWHVFFFGDASQNGCSTQAKQEENNKKSPDVDCVHRPALSDALRSSFSSGHFHFCAQHISTQFECSVSRCRPVSRGQCKNRPIFSDMVTSSVSCNILCKLDANFQWLCRWWPVRLTGCKLATFVSIDKTCENTKQNELVQLPCPWPAILVPSVDGRLVADDPAGCDDPVGLWTDRRSA